MVAVAAPAFASSQCPTGAAEALLTVGTKPTTLTFPPTTVTATVTITRSNPNTIGETGLGKLNAVGIPWNYIKLHQDGGMKKGDSIVSRSRSHSRCRT